MERKRRRPERQMARQRPLQRSSALAETGKGIRLWPRPRYLQRGLSFFEFVQLREVSWATKMVVG